jgi:hypothetical protein
MVYFYVLGDQELLYFNIQLDMPFSPYNILGDILFWKYFSARLFPNCCPQLTCIFLEYQELIVVIVHPSG